MFGKVVCHIARWKADYPFPFFMIWPFPLLGRRKHVLERKGRGENERLHAFNSNLPLSVHNQFHHLPSIEMNESAVRN